MDRVSSFRIARTLVARLTLVIALAAMLVPIIPAGSALAATEWWVDDGGSDAAAGTEAAPFKTITHAMVQASSGDTIWVEPGTYNVGTTIGIRPGVRLESTDGAHLTTIDAGGTKACVIMTNPTVGTALVGFTITGGNWGNGGGIIAHRTVSQGTLAAGWPLIADNIITGNTAIANHGGGIYCTAPSTSPFSPLVEGNEIRDNDAAGGGGGMYCTAYVNPTVRDNRFSFNEAADGGGFCAINNSTPKLIDNRMWANEATMGDGGAVYLGLSGNDPKIRGNHIIGNRAFSKGGGLYLVMCDPTLRENEIANNTAQFGEGGGIYLEFAGAPASNNLIYGNDAAGHGGAAYMGTGYLNLSGDTVYGNTATGWNGLYANQGSMGAITVRNSIVWGHGNQDLWGASVYHSDIQDQNLSASGNTVGAGVIYTDPWFIDAAGDDFRLRVGSPCIDVAHAGTAPSDDFYGTARPQDGDKNGTAVPDMGFFERPPLEPGRLFGDDRYATAVAIAESAFDSADTVVLASGENFPDALTASSLAGAHEGPLLLTRGSALSDVVLPALSDLGASEVVIVGGTAAVSTAVETALTAAGYEVSRLFGADRYATGAQVAYEVARVMGDDFSEAAFVARGDDFPDALAVAPLAYADALPIVLTRPGDLPAVSEGVFTDLGLEQAFIAGGTAAVSTPVENQIGALTGGKGPVRLAGANRYDTARVIAEWVEDEVPGSFAYVGVARGDAFPDALAGGAAAGMHGGLILLTPPTSLAPEASAALTANKVRVVEVDVFGGTAAVSESVRAAIDAALGW